MIQRNSENRGSLSRKSKTKRRMWNQTSKTNAAYSCVICCSQ